MQFDAASFPGRRTAKTYSDHVHAVPYSTAMAPTFFWAEHCLRLSRVASTMARTPSMGQAEVCNQLNWTCVPTEVSRPQVVMRPARADDLPRSNASDQARTLRAYLCCVPRDAGRGHLCAGTSREDAAQGELLIALLAPASGWTVYAAEGGGTVVGFVAIRLNHDTYVGEIRLNRGATTAHAGQGVGTTMYAFAVARMQEAGMHVATVATGGDPSFARHAGPMRRQVLRCTSRVCGYAGSCEQYRSCRPNKPLQARGNCRAQHFRQ